MRGQRGCDIHLALDRVNRIVLSAEHQRRTLDAAKIREHVEGVALATRLGEPTLDLRAADRAARHVRVTRGSGIERKGQSSPCVERGLVDVTLNLQEPAA